jgi:murein DD-endopeptidase MepM/ murein hydrolase activator NlpD
MLEGVSSLSECEQDFPVVESQGKAHLPHSLLSAVTAAAVVAVLNGCSAPADEDVNDDEGDIGQVSQGWATLKGISVGNHTMQGYKTNKIAGQRATICINPTSGNPDLYGHYTGVPTTTNYQFKSTNTGLTPDCISFSSSSSGAYYLGIRDSSTGSGNVSKADLWITDSVQKEVPSGFSKALTWPLPGYTALTDSVYGEFNSPWGNPNIANRPFYPGYTNYVHTGVDIAVPAGTAVKAVCTGPIKKVGVLSNSNDPLQWGYFVDQECTANGSTIAVGYDHLISAGRPALNSTVTVGQTIGTIYNLETGAKAIPGEKNHLHLAICKGTVASCLPQGGALKNTDFLGSFINPSILTNPGIWK